MKISGLWMFTDLEQFKQELLKLDKRKCYKFRVTGNKNEIFIESETITCKAKTFIDYHINNYKNIKVLENAYKGYLILEYIGGLK